MNCSKYGEVYRRKSNSMASGLLYQHMSSHYRRILNAKPTVDTSPPQGFKPRPTRSKKSYCRQSILVDEQSICSSQESFFVVHRDDQLIDKIVASEKYSPAVVSQMDWKQNRRNRPMSDKTTGQLVNGKSEGGCSRHISRSAKQRSRAPADLLERHEDHFEAFGGQFWPRILKSEAESKLRQMRVYHPPKRKAPFSKAEWVNNKKEVGNHDQCTCVCTCSQVGDQQECKEQSQTSSRDSAYNGGTSSTTDSRSPTPCQRKQHGSSTEYIDQNSVRHVSHIAIQTDLIESRRTSTKIHHKRRESNDAAYTKLLHDITQDMIESGQCTDKSVARIISRHVKDNLAHLKRDRMLKEVSNLRKQLGIPVNDDDIEEFFTDEDDPAPAANFQFITEGEMNDTSEPKSWTSLYSQLQKSRVRSPDIISSFESSSDNDKLDLNSTFVIKKVGSKLARSDTRWAGGSLKEEEDDKDSDSSKESTIKELLVTEVKKEESESDDVSSEVDSADDCSET